MVKITKLIHFLMVFMHFSVQFWTLTRIRIRNLEFRIRIWIRQKVPDPCGSTTLKKTRLFFKIQFSLKLSLYLSH
jgi:hypothetical protein